MLGGTVMLPAYAINLEGNEMDKQDKPLFGLIGKMKTLPGNRAELIAILAQGTREMPGCLSYIIAEDNTDSDAIWITEVWTNADYHAASLKLPAVQTSIAAGRPLIAGFDHYFKTTPVVGIKE